MTGMTSDEIGPELPDSLLKTLMSAPAYNHYHANGMDSGSLLPSNLSTERMSTHGR